VASSRATKIPSMPYTHTYILAVHFVTLKVVTDDYRPHYVVGVGKKKNMLLALNTSQVNAGKKVDHMHVYTKSPRRLIDILHIPTFI
jgi:hypothetical protein